MFNWIRNWFKKEEPEITTKFILPNGKPFNIDSLRIQLDMESCPLHTDYTGSTPPINNCNICWEYHSRKHRWSK